MSSQPDDINSDDPENTVSSKYYDIDELQNLKINNSYLLSLFHINACSLSRTCDDLGTLLYIANHLSYKPHQDLNIYKKNELESTFIEIMNLKKSNIFFFSIKMMYM